MTKLIKYLWNSITPLNALFVMPWVFYGFNKALDTWVFYPLGVISFIAWLMTHAICSAIKESK